MLLGEGGDIQPDFVLGRNGDFDYAEPEVGWGDEVLRFAPFAVGGVALGGGEGVGVDEDDEAVGFWEGEGFVEGGRELVVK